MSKLRVIAIGEPDANAEIVEAMRKANVSIVYVDKTRQMGMPIAMAASTAWQLQEEYYALKKLWPSTPPPELTRQDGVPGRHGSKKQRRKNW